MSLFNSLVFLDFMNFMISITSKKTKKQGKVCAQSGGGGRRRSLRQAISLSVGVMGRIDPCCMLGEIRSALPQDAPWPATRQETRAQARARCLSSRPLEFSSALLLQNINSARYREPETSRKYLKGSFVSYMPSNVFKQSVLLFRRVFHAVAGGPDESSAERVDGDPDLARGLPFALFRGQAGLR